jgi:hypothetical protein
VKSYVVQHTAHTTVGKGLALPCFGGILAKSGTGNVVIIGGHRSVTTDSAMTAALRSRVVPAADMLCSA